MYRRASNVDRDERVWSFPPNGWTERRRHQLNTPRDARVPPSVCEDGSAVPLVTPTVFGKFLMGAVTLSTREVDRGVAPVYVVSSLVVVAPPFV